MPILEVRGLVKEYVNARAVDSISFSVDEHEIVGLLGPNGAGKTTTINIILGVLEASAGTISIDGIDVTKHRSKALEQTNFAAVYAQLPGNLTVRQNLSIFGQIYGVRNLSSRVQEIMRLLELEKFSDTRCGLLSSGEQTRVMLAKALINKPKLLLLDEPTASLDPSAARVIRDTIAQYVHDASAGVLWTSHNMHEVAAVCDRVFFLSHGRILLEGNPRTLPQEHGKSDLEELFIAIAREPLSLGVE